jgi:glycine/D-amino acid oxidase-like deaminating enzyme
MGIFVSMNSNVVVIGGGIVGLSTAWQLLNIDRRKLHPRLSHVIRILQRRRNTF